MLSNIGNDHSYLDMSCQSDQQRMTQLGDKDHQSRGGPWSHGPWFFAHQRLFSDDPYRKLWDHEALAKLIDIEQKSGYAKGKGVSIMAYAWDHPSHRSSREWLIQKVHQETGIPMETLSGHEFEDFEKLRRYKEKKWAEHTDATSNLPRNEQFPFNNVLYKSFKEDYVSYAEEIFQYRSEV